MRNLFRVIKRAVLYTVGVRLSRIMIRTALLFVLLASLVSISGFKIDLLKIIVFQFFLFHCWYLYYIVIHQRKHRRVYGIKGYRRLDGIFEIHIGNNIHNSFDFNQSMINIIEYCQNENLKIEFISGLFSYGRMIRMFGDSILLIKPLGPISNLFESEMIKRFEQKPSFNSDHLHRVVLDPHKIKIKTNSRGRKTLSN